MKKILVLVSVDLKRNLKSAKAGLLLIFTLFFTYDFVRIVTPYSMDYDIGITPFVYPVFMDDWSNRLYVILMVCILMSDAPFRNRSERFIQLRVSRYAWFLGKLIYIILISAVFQLVLAFLCTAVFFPDIGFSTDWGYMIRAYYSSISGAVSAGGAVQTGLLDFSPITACITEFVLMTEITAMYGLLIFLLNGIFRNYAGTIIVCILSCVHLLIDSFGVYNLIGFDTGWIPTSWMCLTQFTLEFTAGMAIGILIAILTVLTLANLMLVKKRTIEMCI